MLHSSVNERGKTYKQENLFAGSPIVVKLNSFRIQDCEVAQESEKQYFFEDYCVN